MKHEPEVEEIEDQIIDLDDPEDDEFANYIIDTLNHLFEFVDQDN